MYLSTAIQTIKAHCLKHDSCVNCSFAEYNSDGVRCSLSRRPPLQWETVGVISEHRNIDDVISWLMIEFEITKEQATTLYHLLHITINSFRE